MRAKECELLQEALPDRSLRPAPWDDPTVDSWDSTIVEQPEEYRQYLNKLGLEGCRCYNYKQA